MPSAWLSFWTGDWLWQQAGWENWKNVWWMQISIVIFSINLITSSFLIQKTTTPQPLRGGGTSKSHLIHGRPPTHTWSRSCYWKKYLFDETNVSVFLTIDYKMKIYPKEGMIWHGAMLPYMKETDGNSTRQLITYYMDHVIDNLKNTINWRYFLCLKPLSWGWKKSSQNFRK